MLHQLDCYTRWRCRYFNFRKPIGMYRLRNIYHQNMVIYVVSLKSVKNHYFFVHCTVIKVKYFNSFIFEWSKYWHNVFARSKHLYFHFFFDFYRVCQPGLVILFLLFINCFMLLNIWETHVGLNNCWWTISLKEFHQLCSEILTDLSI